MHRVAILTILALSLPLAGCETLGLSDPPAETTVDLGPACPSTAVLSDAVTVTKLKPGAPLSMLNPADVAFFAEMSQAVLSCNYDRVANRLTLDVNFAVNAKRGPAAAGADPGLDFFVAIVDADNNIISKALYRSQPDMGGKNTNIYTQTVSNFPVPLAMDKRPADYEILTGFQLTPAEFAYNRLPKPVPAARAAAR